MIEAPTQFEEICHFRYATEIGRYFPIWLRTTLQFSSYNVKSILVFYFKALFISGLVTKLCIILLSTSYIVCSPYPCYVKGEYEEDKIQLLLMSSVSKNEIYSSPWES